MDLLSKPRRFVAMSWSDRWVHLRSYEARYLGSIGRLLAATIYVPAAVVLRFAGVRFLISSTSWPNFGHSALEPGLYVKAAMTGLGARHHAIMLAPRRTHPYKTLTRAWREHITVIDNPLLCAILRPFEWNRFVTTDITSTRFQVKSPSGGRLSNGAALDAILKRYEDQFKGRAVLRIRPDVLAEGLRVFDECGITRDDWWVTLHVRENSGMGVSTRTSAAERSRNVDPATYMTAVEAIIARGAHVVRIGGGRETPLPQTDGFIDLTRITDKPEGLDLVAIAGGRLLLSSDSGPNSVAVMLGCPIAGSNFFPLNHGTHPRGIFIPKMLVRKNTNAPLTFSEVLSTHLRDVYQVQDLENENLTWRDNTQDEIEAAAIELLDTLDGEHPYSEDDQELQSTYWQLAFAGSPVGAYGANSRIGSQFLSNWRHLLPGVRY